jgi:hypothetical protein
MNDPNPIPSVTSASTDGSARANHPRLRGEHDDAHVSEEGLNGSPPLTRGARVPAHRPAGHGGNSPARAGSTIPARKSRFPRLRRTSQPHPHPGHPARSRSQASHPAACPGRRLARTLLPAHTVRSAPETSAALRRCAPPCDGVPSRHPNRRQEWLQRCEVGSVRGELTVQAGDSPRNRGRRPPGCGGGGSAEERAESGDALPGSTGLVPGRVGVLPRTEPGVMVHRSEVLGSVWPVTAGGCASGVRRNRRPMRMPIGRDNAVQAPRRAATVIRSCCTGSAPGAGRRAGPAHGGAKAVGICM